MLHQALEHLLESRPFEKISVGEIAEQATLNRATFYDHYPDKFALLEGLVSAQFQALLDKRAIMFNGQCPSALKGIILAMCDYCTGLPGIDRPERRQLDSHFESALMSVVRRMLISGLAHVPPQIALPPALIASTIAGAIYGGVSEWVRTPARGPVEEVVDSIYALVGPMLART